MNLENLQENFLTLVSQSGSEGIRDQFLTWIAGTLDELKCAVNNGKNHSPSEIQDLKQSRKKLAMISDEIRPLMPIEACLPSEEISFPSIGEDRNLNSGNCIHLDAFLYDEAQEETLVEEGKLSRAFCKDCGSKNTQTLTFITHSCSKDRLEYIFTALLPGQHLSGKTLLDVGSRLGAVCYAAYFFSNVSKIIGLEMNSDFCKLQKSMVDKFNLGHRVQIVEGEMTSLPELMQNSDIIVLNNVFGWFMSPEYQVLMWQFIRNNVKSGSFLVTIPSLPESLENLETGIILDNWVTELNPSVDDANFEENLEMSEVKLYRVK